MNANGHESRKPVGQRRVHSWLPRIQPFFLGSFFRLVPANSLSCFLLIDLAICLEGPLSDDVFLSPRFAARAAPAAICCFFDFAGILDHRAPGGRCACRARNQAIRYDKSSYAYDDAASAL